MPVVYIVCLHAVVYMVLGLSRRAYVYGSGVYSVSACSGVDGVGSV